MPSIHYGIKLLMLNRDEKSAYETSPVTYFRDTQAQQNTLQLLTEQKYRT